MLHADTLQPEKRNSVVRIDVTFLQYSYSEPYKAPTIRRAAGTGFIIEGNKILTNAHVVSHANTIRVRRANQRYDVPAHLVYIAHDCDLAMLVVDRPDFFDGAVPLTFGDIPELNSPVFVVGFPVGGERVSITRGIVSRKGMDLYAHSGIDAHLTIQVDAAINPGNSGGPAFQNGEVIGIAFQAYSRGENLGYLIPTNVIHRFLKDISDGTYDGYTEFGIVEIPTYNPVLLQLLGLQSLPGYPDTGVLVISVLPGSSSDGYLQPGDVILSVNGYSLSPEGEAVVHGEQQAYTELIDNLESGSLIDVGILRGGEQKSLSIPAKATSIFDFRRMDYDNPPRYRISGGLVFQPLNANLMETFQKEWTRYGKTNILYRYNYFFAHHLWEKFNETVILTARITDPANLYSGQFLYNVIESVNGKAVKNFRSFNEMLDRAIQTEKYVVIRFENEPAPLVLKSSDLVAAFDRLKENYGIESDRYVLSQKAGEPTGGKGVE